MACVRKGQEAEYRDLIGAFRSWCERNGLLLNTKKTKEMVLDVCRCKPPLQPVNISGKVIEVVQSYRCTWVCTWMASSTVL